MNKDKSTMRNAMLIFRAQVTKKYFAMNLNLRSEERGILVKNRISLKRS